MKTVFTNSQLCHVWANQTQTHGRSGSMFFEGTKIYSYGKHFLAAEIHIVKGQKIALVNSGSYSITTAKHLSEIRSGLRGLMEYFCAPNPSVFGALENIDYYTNRVNEQLERMLSKNRKVTYKKEVNSDLEFLHKLVLETNMFLKLADCSLIKISAKQIEQIKKHYAERYKRYLELNTPEMIAKKEQAKERKLVLQQEKTKRDFDAAVALFRNGGDILPSLRGLKFDLLRIQDNEVVTTRGARAQSYEAKAAIMYLNSVKLSKKKEKELSFKIGGFELTSIKPIVNEKFEDDFVLTVGCHKILLSEAKAVLN